MSTFILVAGDKKFAGLLDFAKAIGNPVTAVVVGDDELVNFVASTGVDEVIAVGTPSADAPVEAFAPAVGKVVAEKAPALVVGSATEAGRVLVGAVAAAVGSAALTGVISVDGGNIEHGLYGGLVNHTVACGGTAVVVANAGADAKAAGGAAAITKADAAPAAGLKVVATREGQAATVDLAAAERVVCIGRALAAKEDLAMIYDFAKSLGAEVGCTRPLAEGQDWMPRETYVGVSGVVVTPELYFGVGLSGQIQHTAGVKAKTAVAVNKDASAPIFNQVDFGIVGDIYTIIPALTDAFNAAK